MSGAERGSRRHRLSVDGERCTGHGRCVAVAGELFALDPETDRSSPKREAIGDADLESARRAARACPEGAVRLTEI